MCAADKVWITELTSIHKNIRLVRNSHVQELTLILKIIGQCDFKHTLTCLPDTFASRTAAKQDEHADAAIGNITGKNRN
jgi:hypothetical protein